MYKEKETDIFIFESTNRRFSTHGSDGISITTNGMLRYGYDGYIELKDNDGFDDSDLELTEEEEKELSIYMIRLWAKFGNISLPTQL